MFVQILTFYLVGMGVVYGTEGEADIKAWFMKHGVECSKDFSVTPEEMEVLHKHKMPDSKTAKCLMACVFRKAHMLDDKGMYDWEKTSEMFSKKYTDDPTKLENSKKLLNMCKKVNDEVVADGENGCERSHHLFECLVKNAPQMGFKM